MQVSLETIGITQGSDKNICRQSPSYTETMQLICNSKKCAKQL